VKIKFRKRNWKWKK